MMFPRVIPVLLLRRDGLVKGIHFKNHKYVGDPMNAVRIFNAKNVDELFLLDITATTECRSPDIDFVQRVADEAYMPFGVGGGIRSVADMQRLIRAGAEKVSINTAAVENPDLIRQASDVFGRQSVVVSVDVGHSWRGRASVYTHSGTRRVNLDPVAWTQKAEELGAGEILLTSIERDGIRRGYALDLVRAVADAVQIPIIACGGAGRFEDLEAVVKEGHASAAAAGSLFVFNGPHRAVLVQYPDRRLSVPLSS